MLRLLHLAHRHASVERLRQQLKSRLGEQHTWVFVGRSEEDDEGVWSVDAAESLPTHILQGEWDAIVVHRMRFPTPKWLLSMPDGPFLVWASWGDDYFRVFPALSRGIHLPKSRMLLGALGKFSVTILALIQSIRRALFPRGWLVTPRDWELHAMAKVDAIVNLFGRDFIAKPYLPQVPDHLYSSWYNAVPSILPEVEASKDEAGPILLGSSASTTGNHLDFIWDHQDELRASGRTLRMVLAYGSGRYAWALRKLADWRLEGQVECLDGRLPLEEYYRYLAQCPVVVHHQIRNQNTGNAVLSFLMGQRVLMRPDSLVHAYFENLGFIIGDATAVPLDLTPLDDASRQYNRELALKCFGDTAVMERYGRFIEDLKRVA